MKPETQKKENSQQQTVSSSFLASLTPTQRKQFSLIVGEKMTTSKDYKKTKKEVLRHGLIMGMCYNWLMNETIKETGMNKQMILMLLLVYAISNSPKYKDNPVTVKAIKAEMGIFKGIYRLFPYIRLQYLIKYGWITHQKGRYNARIFTITEKGYTALQTFSHKYTQLFENFYTNLETD